MTCPPTECLNKNKRIPSNCKACDNCIKDWLKKKEEIREIFHLEGSVEIHLTNQVLCEMLKQAYDIVDNMACIDDVKGSTTDMTVRMNRVPF